MPADFIARSNRSASNLAESARRRYGKAARVAAIGLAGWWLAGAPVVAEVAAGPISELQARLAQAGYDPGPVNGVMSAKTRRAMIALRRAAGPAGLSMPAGDPVLTAQTALQRLGFLAAPADGVIGAQTRDAIIRFQAANHLPVDPRVSDRLLAELDQAGTPAPGPAGTAPAAGPAALAGPAGGAPAAAPAPPEASGREPLPAGVTPPPIR